MSEVYMVYRVKKGDTLARIGKRFHISYKKIVDFNNMSTSRLSINQKLIIPVSAPPVDENAMYTVKKGDTLISIAKAFQTSVSELKRLNKKMNSFIRVGEQLHVYR